MNKYYVRFLKDNKPVCGTLRCASTEESAMLDAEFALICKYPNIQYDNILCEIIEYHV